MVSLIILLTNRKSKNNSIDSGKPVDDRREFTATGSAMPNQTFIGDCRVITRGDGMKISARNQLKGTVRMIKKGPVNTEVHIALPGGNEVVSVITTYSAEKLKLQEGKEVYAVMKASEVMVAID